MEGASSGPTEHPGGYPPAAAAPFPSHPVHVNLKGRPSASNYMQIYCYPPIYCCPLSPLTLCMRT